MNSLQPPLPSFLETDSLESLNRTSPDLPAPLSTVPSLGTRGADPGEVGLGAGSAEITKKSPVPTLCPHEQEQTLPTSGPSSSLSHLCSVHPFGEADRSALVQNTAIQCFCFQKPRGRGWKKENMFMVDLAGISTIDAAPAAGFITLTQLRCLI